MRNDDYQEERREEREVVTPYTILVPGNAATEAYRRARQSYYGPADVSGQSYAAPTRTRYEKEEKATAKERPQKKEKDKKAKKKKAAKTPAVYTARKPILFILAVLMIVAVVVNILPVVGLVPEYTSAFLTKSQDAEATDLVGRSLADPVMSLVTYLIDGDPEAEWTEEDFISQSYFRDCFTKVMLPEDAAEDEKVNTTQLICYLAMPIMIVLFAVITVYLAVKFLLAALKGKKFKFGFSLLVGIIYLVGIAILTVVWNSFGIGEIMGVLTGGLSAFGIGKMPSKAAIGLGFYITAIIFLIAFILNIFAYKKEKVAKSK